MKYKTDLHCHTSEASGCSSVRTVDAVNKYIELGYTTVAITNHFTKGMFPGNMSYEQYVDHHFGVADIAKEAAGDKLNVIYGMELHVKENPNDYLVFGTDRELMKSISDIFTRPIEELCDIFHAHGGLIIQAHPMRPSQIITEAADGYEVLNGHPGWDSGNDRMLAWAQENCPNKILTAGSDHHDPDHRPAVGIMTDEPIKTVQDLIAVLNGRKYEIFDERT